MADAPEVVAIATLPRQRRPPPKALNFSRPRSCVAVLPTQQLISSEICELPDTSCPTPRSADQGEKHAELRRREFIILHEMPDVDVEQRLLQQQSRHCRRHSSAVVVHEPTAVLSRPRVPPRRSSAPFLSANAAVGGDDDFAVRRARPRSGSDNSSSSKLDRNGRFSSSSLSACPMPPPPPSKGILKSARLTREALLGPLTIPPDAAASPPVDTAAAAVAAEQLGEKKIARLRKKGVNPALYAEMKAARKGRRFIGALTGIAYLN